MMMLLLATMLAIQETPKAIQAASPHFTVDVLDAGSDDGGARLMITRKDTTRYHLVTINRALGGVSAVRLRHDQGRVLVFAERGFAVIDPLAQKPRDEVYGYRMMPSDDGRWIAYTRFFPDAESGPREGIVMYDTMRAPDENHGAFPIAAERSSAAGWAAYPPAAKWKRSAAVAADRDLYAVVGIYQWWEQPIHLAAMRVGVKDVMILTDVSGPAMRVCTKELPENPDRWHETPIRLTHSAMPDGGYVVNIDPGTPGSARLVVVFTADCSS